MPNLADRVTAVNHPVRSPGLRYKRHEHSYHAFAKHRGRLTANVTNGFYVGSYFDLKKSAR
jgi:hypothetical protein